MRSTVCIVAMTLVPIADLGAQVSAELVADLDSIAHEWFELGLTPGLSVVVVEGNDVVYERGFGTVDLATGRPVTSESQFYIASTTKAFTALAVSLLASVDELELDAPVTKYLPELQLAAGLDAGEISLRDLLAMRHGIEDGGPVVTRTAYTGEFTNDLLIDLLSEYEPGEQGEAFRYGNLGYNILGLVLDAVDGEGWKRVIQRELFEPLGMASTTAWISQADPERLAMPHAIGPTGEFERIRLAKTDVTMHAAGGHVTSAHDLGRFLLMELNAGSVDGEQVFPAAVVTETQRRQVDQDRQFGSYHRDGWGLGWDLAVYDGDRILTRFGTFSGFRSHVSFMPERRVGVAVLVNDLFLGSLVVDRLANSLYDRVLEKLELSARLESELDLARAEASERRRRWRESLARRADRQAPLPLPFTAYTGSFENPTWGTIEVRVVDDGLEARWGVARSPMEVYDVDTARFRVELQGGGDVVTYTIGADRATSIEIEGAIFERRR